VHGHCVEQLGGEDVEVKRPVAVGSTIGIGCADGGQRFHSVDPDARELRSEPSHGDLSAFAGVTHDRDTGDALDGLGKIQFREGRDVVRDDLVD
jgi:hypothetical protein